MPDARVIRREEDLKRIKTLTENYPGILELVGTNGTPINSILLKINLPTAGSKNYPKEVINTTDLRIDLATNYPLTEPKITITSRIWNPNVYSSGLICHGPKWLPTETLDLLIVWTMKLLVYEPGIVNINSPANSEAAKWYDQLRKNNPATFPTANIEKYKKNKPDIAWKDLGPIDDKVIIACPSCGYNYKVPKGKNLKVTCNNCKNIFLTKV